MQPMGRPALDTHPTSGKSGRRTPEQSLASLLRRKYGLSLADYHALLEGQGGVCAICGNPPKRTAPQNMRLHVDHCHKTGQVRGLLCRDCNVFIGLAQECPERLRSAIEYLSCSV